ncbi:MAG TPA: hypothetical protein VGM68_07495 [Rhizomicrobium sp.]|jgi:hypothetical protein
MRIPSAMELSEGEWATLRNLVSRNFTPVRQIDTAHKARLMGLGLIQLGMGGVIVTPAGRIVARAR